MGTTTPLDEFERAYRVSKELEHKVASKIKEMEAQAEEEQFAKNVVPWPSQPAPEPTGKCNGAFKRNSLAEYDFERNGKSLVKNEKNVLIALAKMGVHVSYNEFSYETLVEGFPEHGPLLNDLAEDSLYLAIAREFKLKPAFPDFQRIIGVEAYRNRFHPVRKYLAQVQDEWDGVERIDEWLSTYFGAKNDAEGLIRAIGRLMLIAAGKARRRQKPRPASAVP